MNKIQLSDGTQLIINEMRNGVIDIMLTHSTMTIIPISSNHIQVKKIDIRVPEHTIEALKKEGVIK